MSAATALVGADPSIEAPDALADDTGTGSGTAARERVRPSLSVIPGGAARIGRTTFGIIIAALLGAGLIAVLMLNTVLAQGAFTIHELEKQSTALLVQQQKLEQAVGALESPMELERRARDLGMVSMRSPVFLRLSDGRVLGSAKAADPADSTLRAGASATGASASPGASATPAATTPAAKTPAATTPAATTPARESAAQAAAAGDGAVAVVSGTGR